MSAVPISRFPKGVLRLLDVLVHSIRGRFQARVALAETAAPVMRWRWLATSSRCGLTGPVNASSAAPGASSTPAVERARRLILWLGDQAVTSAAAVAHLAARVRDAMRRRSATPAGIATQDTPREPTDGTDARPRWGVLAAATAIAAGLFAVRLGLATSLYWYVFPLFGIGIAYVIQFRSELTARWRAVLAVSAVISAVGLARDWVFSGHVLWNVLFLGHAAQSPARRTWIGVLLASLVHLVAMKLAFQRPRDVVGAVISVAAAMVALPLAGPRRDRRRSPSAALPSMSDL